MYKLFCAICVFILYYYRGVVSRLWSSINEYLPANITARSVIIAGVVGFIVYRLMRKKYRLPPGPFALPLIGNYEFFTDKKLHKTLFKLSQKYGPVLRVHLGPSRWIVLNNIEVVTEAMIKKGADFADRPYIPSIDEFTQGSKDIAFGKYGPTWKFHRKIAGKALRQYLVGGHLETIVHEACEKVFKVMSAEQKAFDPAKCCDFLVFNILCAICFGKTYEIDDDEFLLIMKLDNDLLEKFGTGVIEDIIPYLRDVCPTRRYRDIMKDAKQFISIMEKKYKEHLYTFDKDNIRDFTDSLILARKEAEEEDDPELLSQITETHLVQTLMDIFFAGVDTSRMTINWAIMHMASLPEIQAKVQEELDRVVGTSRLPGISDRSKLNYTEATLHESMRVNMAATIGVPHKTTCDTSVGGYDIPKGTTVMINHYALHRDPNFWKDPETFDPARFLDSDGKLSAKPESWLPFSAGRRVCLGESVAKPELVLILACLLQKFKIKLPPGATVKFESNVAFEVMPDKYEILVEERY